MGKLSLSSSSQLNMKLQVIMCDQLDKPPSSMVDNGDDNIPVVSVLTPFENIEELKSKLNGSPPSNDVEVLPSSSNGEEEGGERETTISSNTQRSSFSDMKDIDGTMSVSSDDTLTCSTNNQIQSQEQKLQNLSLGDKDLEDVNSISSSALSSTGSDSVQTVMPSSAWTDDLPVEVGASARFSKVLENISLPLLYIPTTKQLVTSSEEAAFNGIPVSERHEGSSSHVEKDACAMLLPEGDYLCNGSDSSSTRLDLSSQELLPQQRSPMHKAHSAQDFQYTGQLTEPDRLTLHSVESYPGYQLAFESSVRLFNDTSSLSSVSTGTDFSVSAASVGDECNAESRSVQYDVTDEALFMEINLHSRNTYDKTRNSNSLDSGYGERRVVQPPHQSVKKKFSGFKNLFTKRSKEESPPGWKLFGKVPAKSTSQRNAEEITSEFHARHRRPTERLQPSVSTGNKHDTEVMSTTALILENRPKNLPLKNPEEAEKHRQQYEEMVEAAKKKEQKDLKLKKKQLLQQRRLEDKLTSAARVWNEEILPNWDVMRLSKKARDLWWMGLPPNIRGKVWKLAIGNDLNITHELYEICHERAEDRIRLVQAENNMSSTTTDCVSSPPEPSNTSNKEASVNVIKLDVSRTFPQLCIFQKGGPYHDLLHSLLGAYACYRPDVGYVQGMSFIAAILLLNMEVADAFVCFANLLNRPCQVTFFRMDENQMTAYYKTFEEFFTDSLPRLAAHFATQHVTPNLYLMEWVFLLFGKSLPLDVACRIWDVFCRDGEEFLFRAAIGILRLYETVLLKMDFIHVAQFLTKLPEDICAEHLFREIDNVKMNIDKRGFHAVHSNHRDLQESAS